MQFETLSAELKSDGYPERELNLCVDFEDLKKLREKHAEKRVVPLANDSPDKSREFRFQEVYTPSYKFFVHFKVHGER